MVGGASVLYEHLVLVDTSAVVALLDPNDQSHEDAVGFFETAQGVQWVSVNVTAHETYTRLRYGHSVARGFEGYDLLRSSKFRVVDITAVDDAAAMKLLKNDQRQLLLPVDDN